VLMYRLHLRRCLCVTCWTRRHPDSCTCFRCGQRRLAEADYRTRMERAERSPVSSDRAAAHVARLGLTRRAVARELGCSVSTAQRVSVAGGFIPRALERRVLDLEAAP
jgi:hypothetical protein